MSSIIKSYLEQVQQTREGVVVSQESVEDTSVAKGSLLDKYISMESTDEEELVSQQDPEDTGDNNDEVDTAKEAEVEVEPAETGGDEELPESDDQVTGTELKEEGVEGEDKETDPVTDSQEAAVETKASQEAIVVEEASKVSKEDHLEPIEGAVGQDQDEVKLTDGEDELEVVEAPEPSIDTVEEKITESHIEVTEIEKDLERLNEAQTAMESYLDLMGQCMEDGGLNAQAAQFMRLGMEQYEDLFGLEEPLTASVESFGGSMSQKYATQVSMESIQEFLKKAWEYAKGILRKLWGALQDYLTQLTAGLQKVETQAKALSVQAKESEKKNDKPTVDKITVNGAKRLQGDGTIYHSRELLKQASKPMMFMVTDYFDIVADYAKVLADELKSITPDNMNEEASSQLISNVKKILSKMPGSADTSNKYTEKDSVGVVSTVLPGDKVIVVQCKTSETDDFVSMASVSMELKDSVDTSSKDTVEVNVKSLSDLGNHAIDVAKLAQQVIDGTKSRGNARKAVDTLIKAGDDFKKRMDGEELTAEQRNTASRILSSLTVVQKLVGSSYGGAIRHMAGFLAAQNALISAQLATYRPQSTEVATA